MPEPSVPRVLSRAVDLAGDTDVPGAVASLCRERTGDLHAAYAVAVRRRTEGRAYVRAAQLIETTLLARRRRLLRPPRRLSRPELLPLLVVVLAVLVVVMRLTLGVWAIGLIVYPIVWGTVWWSAQLVLTRRAGGRLLLERGDRAGLERSAVTRDAVIDRADDGGASPADIVAVADHHARGVGGPLVAAAAIAAAERQVTAAGLLASHRRLRPVLAEARELAGGRDEVVALRAACR